MAGTVLRGDGTQRGPCQRLLQPAQRSGGRDRPASRDLILRQSPVGKSYPVSQDQIRAITASVINAVPIQPNAISQLLALNRPISFELATITIIIAMIGTATMPLSTALHTSM